MISVPSPLADEVPLMFLTCQSGKLSAWRWRTCSRDNRAEASKPSHGTHLFFVSEEEAVAFVEDGDALTMITLRFNVVVGGTDFIICVMLR